MPNNIDKDIEIVEEKIKVLNSHILSYKKSDCETSFYRTLIAERNALVNVLEELKTRGKMIDSMAKWISNESCREGFKDSIEEVKEHFRKEAEKNES